MEVILLLGDLVWQLTKVGAIVFVIPTIIFYNLLWWLGWAQADMAAACNYSEGIQEVWAHALLYTLGFWFLVVAAAVISVWKDTAPKSLIDPSA
jgi:hypothetical protein